VHLYVNVPAVGNVNWNSAPGAMDPESNDPSSAVTVWASAPSFFHLTTWPAFTATSAGSYPWGEPGGMSLTLTMVGAAAASASGEDTACTNPKLTAKAPTTNAAIIESFALVTLMTPLVENFQFVTGLWDGMKRSIPANRFFNPEPGTYGTGACRGVVAM
jgi:hypothetical protein